jgi:hypothetical protein
LTVGGRALLDGLEQFDLCRGQDLAGGELVDCAHQQRRCLRTLQLPHGLERGLLFHLGLAGGETLDG